MADDKEVRVNLVTIDSWKSLLGTINNDCMEDIRSISRILEGDLTGFKGTTATKAKELAKELMDSATTAHDNLSNVSKTLTKVQDSATKL